MKPFVLALRAIGAEFVIRLCIPIAVIILAGFALLMASAYWLTTFSGWWWLLFIPITSLFIVLCTVGFVVLMLVRFVRPLQTKAQQKAVKQFVDKLQGVAEIVGTPKFIVLFRVVRSIAAPSSNTYLSNLVEDRELAKDFREIQASFNA